MLIPNLWLLSLALPSPELYALTRAQERFSVCSMTTMS
jgi:hypothetical protein